MKSSKRRRRLPVFVGSSSFLRSLSRLRPPPFKSSPPLENFPSIPLLRRRRRRRGVNSTAPPSPEEEGVEEQEEATVQLDLGFFDPKPGDFHGVKLLTKSFLDDREWDLTGFVDLILQQNTVGTVVKWDDEDGDGDGVGGEEEGLYAVVSALNLGRYANHKCIKDVKEYLINMCPKTLEEKFRSLIMDQARDVALLVCERFVNYPEQAVPPLYKGLFDEIEWATEDEPTKEIQNFFRFKFYLFVTKIYVKKLSNKQEVSCNRYESDQSVVYIKPEDEIFQKLSSFSFTFDLHCGHVVTPEMKAYKKIGLAMVVKSERVPSILQEMNSLGI